MTIRRYIENNPLQATILGSILFMVVGASVAWKISGDIAVKNAKNKTLRLDQSDYPLINPLLLCNIDSKESDEDKILDARLHQFINERKSHGDVTDMSVYFVNYKAGQWVGVNENDKYDPASMLKVPVMMAYYKYAETNPSILSEVVSYNGDDQNADEYFKSKNDIKPGKVYTIEDLIQSMIVNSDNTALALLENYLNKNDILDAYTDLKLQLPKEGSNLDYMSARLYAFFFRVLYNGTYLTRQYSEEALELLGRSSFAGIRAGVPSGTQVSQKFGERSVYDENGVLQFRELHDCGYVYKKNSPYLLCIMSRGKDFDVLRQNIVDLSKLVYDYI